MMYRICLISCFVFFELATSSPIVVDQHFNTGSQASSWLPEVNRPDVTRGKRQSIIGDIFQIPIQTLTAIGQLFSSVQTQRDKRRKTETSNYNNNNNNNGGYSTYDNGDDATVNGQTSYNNGYNAYNNGNNNGQTAYNSYRPNNNGGSSYSNSYSNNIGANAFNKPANNNAYNQNSNTGFNKPFHYLSDYMTGYNRVSRTHGAKIAELTVAADGSSFKI